MKRVAMVFGLVSGTVWVLMLVAVVRLMASGSYGLMALAGYSAMVVSGLMVFFGIRSFREGQPDERLTFRRGLLVGLAISLVSSACYIAAFELVNFVLVPDLADRYAACSVDKARAAGATPEELQRTQRQAEMLRGWWSKPHTLGLVVFAESFPVGAIASLLSAAFLRRRGKIAE